MLVDTHKQDKGIIKLVPLQQFSGGIADVSINEERSISPAVEESSNSVDSYGFQITAVSFIFYGAPECYNVSYRVTLYSTIHQSSSLITKAIPV